MTTDLSVVANKRLFRLGLIMLLLISLPVAANAGILDIVITAITCTGNAFGTSCSVNEQKLFASIACKVMQNIDHAIIPIYCNITLNPSYIMFLNAAVTLYIIFLGLGFVSGMIKMKLGEIIIALIKVTFIYFLLTNAGFFFSFVYRAVLETPQSVIKSILSMHGSSANNIFEYVDEGMYRMFTEVFKPEATPEDRISHVGAELSIVAIAIGITQLMPGGNFVYGLFVFVIIGWIFTYLSIIVRYLLAYMSIVFLLMLAPIFVPSLLFKKTTYLWDEWLKYLISFVIEIIIVVAFVIMIEKFYTEFFDMLKNAFNNLKFENQDLTYLKQYDGGAGNVAAGQNGLGDNAMHQFDNAQNTADTGTIKQEKIQSIANPVGAFNAAGFGGDATGISSDVIIQLVTMAVVVFLSRIFLDYIPSFAGMLAGQFRFSKNFGGENFSQKGSAGRTNLFGQTGFEAKKTSADDAADAPGGVWGDLGAMFR